MPTTAQVLAIFLLFFLFFLNIEKIDKRYTKIVNRHLKTLKNATLAAIQTSTGISKTYFRHLSHAQKDLKRPYGEVRTASTGISALRIGFFVCATGLSEPRSTHLTGLNRAHKTHKNKGKTWTPPSHMPESASKPHRCQNLHLCKCRKYAGNRAPYAGTAKYSGSRPYLGSLHL